MSCLLCLNASNGYLNGCLEFTVQHPWHLILNIWWFKYNNNIINTAGTKHLDVFPYVEEFSSDKIYKMKGYVVDLLV